MRVQDNPIADALVLKTGGLRTSTSADMDGPTRHLIHNRDLHQQGQMRRHGGYQWGLPLS